MLAEGWGALVGYDYVAGAACPLPDVLVAALERDGAVARGLTAPQPSSASSSSSQSISRRASGICSRSATIPKSTLPQ